MASNLKSAVKNLPTYDEEKDGSFRNHMYTLRRWMVINDISDNQEKKLALIYSIRGKSAERVLHLDSGSSTWTTNADYKDYEEQVLQVFHPKVEAELAKTEFLMRRQTAREDVGSYLSSKYSLFVTAHTENGPFAILMTEIIKGLFSPVVKRHVRRGEVQDFEGLKNLIFRIVAAERQSFLEGYGESNSLDGLAAVSSNVRQARGTEHQSLEDEKMDISRVQSVPNGSGNQRNPQKETRKCHRCGLSGHLQKDCRKGKATGNKHADKTCYYCKKRGHIEANCFKKKGKSQSPSSPKVNQFKAEARSELEEEDLFTLLEQGQVSEISAPGNEKPLLVESKRAGRD